MYLLNPTLRYVKPKKNPLVRKSMELMKDADKKVHKVRLKLHTGRIEAT